MQERPGLVVLTIELEGALAQMPGNLSPSRMWSPYREPLAKFLNKYSVDVGTASVGLTVGQRLFLLFGRPSSQTMLLFGVSAEMLERHIMSGTAVLMWQKLMNTC